MTTATETPTPQALPERLRFARWDLLLQDYLVAARRFRWSGKRNSGHDKAKPWKVNSRSSDRIAHGDELRTLLLDLAALGVNPRNPPPGPETNTARRIARSRLRDDIRAGRCLCSSPLCTRTLPEEASA